jgi:hypothetical protein
VGTSGPRCVCFLSYRRESNSRPPRFSPERSTEVTRTFTTPESLAEGTSGPSGLLCHLSYSSFHRRRDLNPQPFYEVARAFTTLQILAAGISGPGFFVRCSATELQQLSSLVGIEPTTLGSRCNPSLHHAANSPIFFIPSLLPYLVFRAHP